MNVLLRWSFVLIFIISSLSFIISFDQNAVYTNFWVIEITSENGELEAKEIANDFNLEYHGPVGNLKGFYVLKERENSTSTPRGRARRDVESLYGKLKRNKKVRFVEPQVKLKRTKRQSFSDPLYGDQWNLHGGTGKYLNILFIHNVPLTF